MFSPSTPRHNWRTMYTAPLRPTVPHRVPLSPRRALCCPSCLPASIPFDRTGDSPRCASRPVSPRLASSRLASSSFSLPAAIPLPRSALARGATSDALCCRRVVAAAASILRLSRFRLGCRRGSRGDSRPLDMHLVSFEINQNPHGEKLKNLIYRYDDILFIILS